MKRFFEMLLALGVGILITVLVITVVNIRSDQVDNNLVLDKLKQNSKISRHALREIRSCVQPDGACYKDGEKRTGRAVANIGQVTILAAACAGDYNLVGLGTPERAARIQKCIVRELNNGKH